MLPLGDGGLARAKKGIFGLADSPRRWYLRLNKSVTKLGWVRSELDAALWFLWSEDGGRLEGMLLSHVDDLLMGGNDRAHRLLLELGRELGFGSLETGSFTYCGKKIEQFADFSIKISMTEYHENVKAIPIPNDRKKQLDDQLTPTEHRQLRGLLGSLQWLVSQLRFDQGFALSTLQSEKPVVATMMKANGLLKKFKAEPNFAIHFKPLDLTKCGLVVVSDAALGNVCQDGSTGEDALARVRSQAAHAILIADEDMIAGKEGNFCLLDSRSHRLARVCRSTFAAELMSAEEALDSGEFCRGALAETMGYSIDRRNAEASNDNIPMALVVDAKDVFDKSTSDTPSYGSQKSLAFTISWIRAQLRRPNLRIHWTATQNMIIDCGTKEMDGEHLRQVLSSGRWCFKYSQNYVRQGSKPLKRVKIASSQLPTACIGQKLDPADPMFGHLLTLSDQLGWHVFDDFGVHVAKNARSFRSPKPRFDPVQFPRRSTYGRFTDGEGKAEWRLLEDKVKMASLRNSQALIGDNADLLITCFLRDIDQQKKLISCEMHD